jgi:uncharacterized membrane protein SirB2
MDEALTRNLRILIILAVIAITGFDIIQSGQTSIWWIFGILVVIVLAVLFIQDRRARNRQKKDVVA